ncbi:MAG: transposase [Actinomycetota bacterium]|nr:transposase [Actinomycetota bacterium]
MGRLGTGSRSRRRKRTKAKRSVLTSRTWGRSEIGSWRLLIRDRDSKFSESFDEVLRTEGIRVILTQIRSPKANAFAERCVKTLRSEVLDWTLILGRRHLDRVARSYACHYNAQRPHRALGLRAPESHCDVDPVETVPEIQRCDLVGGLIREYHAVAA